MKAAGSDSCMNSRVEPGNSGQVERRVSSVSLTSVVRRAPFV